MLPRPRVSLFTLFALVGLVACGLAALQLWVYVPMRTGTMYTVIAYQRDWDRLISPGPAQEQGDFRMHTFGVAPQELFKKFSPQPQLWAEKNILEMGETMPRQRPPLRSYSAMRMRRAYSPLGRSKELRGPDDPWVIDQVAVTGVFDESALPPKRYLIDCTTELGLGIEFAEWPTTTSALRSHLRYTGPARGLMVFSRPINDELVQLLILDLR